MNRQLSSKAIWLVLICWIFSGCANPGTLVTETTTTHAIKTVATTATLQPILTLTPYPLQLAIPVITMSPQESENALLGLMRTNGNCTRKCLAGIRPDEMSMQEAVNTMSQWGMIRIGKNNQGKTFINLEPNLIHKNVTVYLSVGTWTNEYESIDTIMFRMQGFSEQFIGSDLWLENREAWQGFSLHNLLKAYGVPSYVGYFFQTTVRPGSSLTGRTISYSLEIQYDQIDLLVGIGAMAYNDGKNIILCPSKDPHDLGVVISPERSLKERREFYPVTWRALTDMDLEAFYKIFTNEANPDACITTNLEQIQLLQPYFR